MSIPVRLAIIGSTRFVYAAGMVRALRLARQYCAEFEAGISREGGAVVSGGAPGVDAAGLKVAAEYGWTESNGKMVVYRPSAQNWPAFKVRNEKVAGDCTHLLRVYCSASTTYGSGWTADVAERRGVIVHRYRVDAVTGVVERTS